MPFGFDSALKVYADLIVNLGDDATSSRKTYNVVRAMGRAASHIALECALQAHPNLTFLAEEVEAEGLTLTAIIKQFADLVCNSALMKKNFGLVVIPNGLVEFMPDGSARIVELNEIMADAPGSTVEQCLRTVTGPCLSFRATIVS